MSQIVLLAGFPRSGTTWFANLINTHAKVVYRHELLGRSHTLFGKDLFHKIKEDCGLSDLDFNKTLSLIKEARIETDKPPFFKKGYGFSKHPDIRYFTWLAANSLPTMRKLYKLLYSINRDDLMFLMKETRSLQNFESILRGLRTDHLMFLVRHPGGAIHSHIRGIEKGLMNPSTAGERSRLYQAFIAAGLDDKKRRSENEFLKMTEVEFLSHSWDFYHRKMMRLCNKYNTFIFNYEQSTIAPKRTAKIVYDILNLGKDKTTENNLTELKSNNPIKRFIKRDSSDQYYSVQRGAEFNPDSWKDNISAHEKEVIKNITGSTWDLLEERFVCVE